jgi:hypothetical protein
MAENLKLKQKDERSWLDALVDWMDSGEHSFVTLLSKIIPLIVPIIPAYVGYSHVTKELEFDPFFGWIYGIVIEGLGYSAIFKAIQFWEGNKKLTSDKNKSPLWVAIAIYIVYLIVILTVNVLLDWQSGVIWWRVLAVALISLLSIPAGLLMSISAVHTERKLERLERNERIRVRKLSESSVESSLESDEKVSETFSETFPKDWRKLRQQLSKEDLRKLANLSPAEMKVLADRHQVDIKTISNWRHYATEELSKTSPLSY